jgi:beta-lactam-binding protein with PASTA domain
VRFLKTFGIHILLIAVVLYLLTWVAAGFLSSYTRHGQYLTLPNLKGLPIEEAEKVLNEKQLRFIITDTVFVDGMPKSAVVEQNPIPNSKVKTGRIIYLSINSTSSATVIMPNLINSSLRYAETVLGGMGLRLGDVSYKPDIAQNAVLDQSWGGQSIQPGTRIPKGAAINLVVGDGSGGALVSMPDLTGLSLLDATKVIEGSMLQLGAIVYEGAVSDSSKAVVIRQNPPFSESSSIRSGEMVDVFLSVKK